MPNGKILRDTGNGPGLVSSDGQQFAFTLERHWRSDQQPTVGMTVEIVLSEIGALTSLKPVPMQQQVTAQMQQLQGSLTQAGNKLKQQGLPFVKIYGDAVVQRLGWTKLAAMLALLLGWLAFATVSIRISGSMSQSLSLHDTLKLINLDGSLQALGALSQAGAGGYGALMWLALAAPLLPDFWRNRWAAVGLGAPLGFMTLMGMVLYIKLSAGLSDAGKMAGGLGGPQAQAFAKRMADEMISHVMQALSLGFGFYLSMAAALLLAAVGIRQALAAQPPVAV